MSTRERYGASTPTLSPTVQPIDETDRDARVVLNCADACRALLRRQLETRQYSEVARNAWLQRHGASA